MKLLVPTAVVAVLLTCGAVAFAAYDVRMVGVVFDPGAEQIKVTETITGDESVMYRFRPHKGQTLHVRLETDSDHTAFIVYAPGKWPGKVLHDSDESGAMEYRGEVGKTGPHAVSVFQSQRAIEQGLSSEFELLLEVTGSPE